MWNKGKKEPEKENKFRGRRQYNVRAGHPEKTLKRLIDLHELLQCDPDEHGYVVTTFKEMNELTEMDVNLMTIMIQNGIMRKTITGGSPKFKYKWDTIEPSMDMAVKLLDKKMDMKRPPDVVSDSIPESIVTTTDDGEVRNEVIVHDEPEEFDSSIIVDSKVAGDVMTMHVNLKKLGIKETDVLNAVLAINANK